MQHNNDFIENLRCSDQSGEQFINREYDYDMLQNEKYRNMFNFIPLELREYKQQNI